MKSRKTFSVLIVMLAFSLCLAVMTAPAQKSKGGVAAITSADLDQRLVQGATVKYVLADSEIVGQPLLYSNGSIFRRCDARIIVDYTDIDNRRDERGRKLYRLKINRPDFYGGAFEKDAPFDSGRDLGSFDGLQPGDLVN
jgi:hypothetical protein